MRIPKTHLSVVSMAAWIALVGLCAAQQPAVKRTELQRGNLSASGFEVVQAVAEFPQGAEIGKHLHPGEEVSYIVEGAITLEVDGQPAVTKKAGDAFIVSAWKTHNAKNTGSGTAKVLATYVIEKGKPVAIPVP